MSPAGVAVAVVIALLITPVAIMVGRNRGHRNFSPRTNTGATPRTFVSPGSAATETVWDLSGRARAVLG
jgi:hypothetical protein